MIPIPQGNIILRPPPRRARCRTTALVATVAILLTGRLFLTNPVAVVAQQFSITSSTTPEGGTVVVQWEQGRRGTVSVKGNEVLVTSKGPLGEIDVAKLKRGAGELVRSIDTGYDTLLLVLHEKATVHLSRTPSGVALSFKQREPAGEDVRMALVRSRLAYREGRGQEGAKILEELRATHPHHREVLLASAYAEAESRRPCQAIAYFDQAHQLAALDPGEQRAVRAIQEGIRGHGRATFESREASSRWKLRTASLRAESPITKTPCATERIGVVLDRLDAQLKGLSTTSGAVGRFDDDRYRYELWYEHPISERSEIRYVVTGSAEAPGGGVIFSHREEHGGQIVASLMGNEPEWRYLEGIRDEAVRHRAAVTRTVPLTDAMDLSYGGGVQRYDSDTAHGVAATGGLQGSLTYQLTKKPVDLRVRYAIDAEYAFDEVRKVDRYGQRYNPIGFEDREVHLLALNASAPLGDRTSIGAFAGYAVDRLGGKAPQAGVTLRRELGPRFSLDLEVSQSLASGDTSGEEKRIFGGLTARW